MTAQLLLLLGGSGYCHSVFSVHFAIVCCFSETAVLQQLKHCILPKVTSIKATADPLPLFFVNIFAHAYKLAHAHLWSGTDFVPGTDQVLARKVVVEGPWLADVQTVNNKKKYPVINIRLAVPVPSTYQLRGTCIWICFWPTSTHCSCADVSYSC